MEPEHLFKQCHDPKGQSHITELGTLAFPVVLTYPPPHPLLVIHVFQKYLRNFSDACLHPPCLSFGWQIPHFNL